MKIIWSEMAQHSLDATVEYVQHEFGDVARRKFVETVKHTVTLLCSNPNIGIVEERLSNAPVEYRSIIVGRLNRIVYFVEDNTIQVADFWNMRRSPKTLTDRLLS